MAHPLTPRKKRSDWLGKRTPVLVRLPEGVAEHLAREARDRCCSLSEAAANLITAALDEQGAA